VCTASIGVLLNNLIEFKPELPEWKTKAINQYEVITYNKVFVKFEKKFWKNVSDIFIANDKRGYFAWWLPV
jgi:polyamine oxidase